MTNPANPGMPGSNPNVGPTGATAAPPGGGQGKPVYCTCGHTMAAHLATKVVPRVGSCGFCHCANFEERTESPQAEHLSEQAKRALQILSDCEAFRTIPRESLAELARGCRRRLFLAGAQLIEQGAPSDSLHILVKGRVKVERAGELDKPLLLAELGPGEVVGEMGVLDGSPRTATVTAIDDLETLQLDAPTISATFRDFPDALAAIMTLVNERMRNTDALVEQTLAIALRQLQTPHSG